MHHLIQHVFSPLLLLTYLVMSGSDSPGQAVEAEEIVKQLEMEQVEEMPTSTATSREPLSVPLYTSAMPSAFRPPSSTHTPAEESENSPHSDLPPLTGVKDMTLLDFSMGELSFHLSFLFLKESWIKKNRHFTKI